MIAIYIYFLLNAFLTGVVMAIEEEKKSKVILKSMLITFLFGVFIYLWITFKPNKR